MKREILRTNLLAGLRGRYYEGLLLILLACLAGWGTRMNAPRLLVDFGSLWETQPPDSDLPSNASHGFPARREDVVEFRHAFPTPQDCLEHSCKFIAAGLGETVVVAVNGITLQRPSGWQNVSVTERRGALGVDLPPSILKSGDTLNEIRLTTRAYNLRAEAMAGPAGIARYDNGAEWLRWRAFRDEFLPLAISLLTTMVVFGLSCLSFGNVEPHTRFPLQRYALANTLVMVGFTRLYHLAPSPIFILAFHFLLRFFADYAFISLWKQETQGSSRWWRPLQLLYAIGFVTLALATLVGIVAFYTDIRFEGTVFVRGFLFYYYPFVSLCVLVMCVAAIRQRSWKAALGYAAFAFMGGHDYLLGYRYIQGTFFFKYFHLLAAFGCLFALVRRAAFARAQELATRRAEQALVQLAQQVDHDIRSPLAALDVATGELTETSESVRSIICIAVGRIREIADSLRAGKKETRGGVSSLRDLVEAVVLEKRLQFKHHDALQLRLKCHAPHQLVLLSASALKRVISNLLNNAVEAVQGRGDVAITVHGNATRAYISITDSGPGIPPQVMARLGERGATFGKIGGTGLGIYHAVNTIRAMEGEVRFDVPESGGTRVTVELPIAPAPS